MIKKYRQKSPLFEAAQLTSDNVEAVAQWCNGRPLRACTVTKNDSIGAVATINIKTATGSRWVQEGDFVVKDEHGRFWKCDKEMFLNLYQLDVD